MEKSIKIRLCILMFLQFFVAGATYPIMSLYLLQYLEFSGSQAGVIMGMSAFSSIISPLFAACIADRFLKAERLLGLCHLVGAVIMFTFSLQTSFFPVLILYFAYTLIVMPAAALTNAITFHHSPEDREKFGNIRVWGTIGWIAVAWFSFTWFRDSSNLRQIIILSAASSLVLALYSLFLPKSKTQPTEKCAQKLFPVESFRMMLRPEILSLCILAMFITFVDKFYVVGTSPFLNHIGFSDRQIMPAMSLGQIPEIFAMGMLGFMIYRLGYKRVMIFGVLLEIFRFSVFALTEVRWLVYTGLSVHGLAYTLIFITTFITLDKFCTEKERTGVHQFFSVMTVGLGGFLGGTAAGRITDLFTSSENVVNFTAFWAVPAIISVFILIFMILFLKEPEKKKEKLSDIVSAEEEALIAAE
ncbi:major facilitator transporter [Chitinispirillum alkaliphilum]|nr:major facilitator transporter [Chitinispirillum alkaliphilum]